jgi:cyclic-di-AMP phosphodiesterase PgpH
MTSRMGSGKAKIHHISIQFLSLVLLSVIIGYLISPKIIFQPAVYKEGDIILQTIHFNEDLLIPDRVSTRLKRENLLVEQRRIFDFDPQVRANVQARIQETFDRFRELNFTLNSQIEDIGERNRSIGLQYFNTTTSQQSVDKQIVFYNKFKTVLVQRRKSFENEGTLSEKGFEKKARNDADLNVINLVLIELADRRKYHQLELGSFGDRFSEMEVQNQALQVSILDKRKAAIDEFGKSLSIDLSEPEKQVLDLNFLTKDLEEQLVRLLSEVLTRKIVVSKEVLPVEKDKIEIRNLVSGEITITETTDDFLELRTARVLISTLIGGNLLEDESGKKKNLLNILGQKLVRPTVSENKQEYEDRKVELVSNMSPVFFSVKKGEIIARAGDRATAHQVELINSYYEVAANQEKLPGLIGVVLFAFISLLLMIIALRLPGRVLETGIKNHLLILTAILLSLLIVKGGALVGELVETRYLSVQNQAYQYLLPVTLGSMLVGILLSFEAAVLTGLLSALFCTIMLQSDLYYFVYAILGCIVASLPVTKFESRYSLLLHGLKISAINLPMVLIIYLIESNQVGVFSWFSIVAGLIAGVLTAIIISFLLPFFESIFDVTTNIKLLELSNMNHPVLKELILKAPGTYQHSIIVGNLAEVGAQEIGANPLLARVAAYYHDIGKAADASFFIENQAPNLPNIHDSMDPYDSTDVIIKHLKDGVDTSVKNRLGRVIADIIQQHHGTNLVRYFFNKAVEQNSENDDSRQIEESRFRYPGPKPQSLEAALVMLADISEACCRSLDSPESDLIKEMTGKVCWNIMKDGQLDESSMTLNQYHAVVAVYTKMLISFYHQRIKYPEHESSEIPPQLAKLEN